MSRYLTLAGLEAGLPEILNAPKDNGTLAAIVIRPQPGQRVELGSCEVSLKLGTHGDNWPNGCLKTTDNGSPHPDVQICIMPLLRFEWVTLGKHSNHPTVRPGRPSLRPDLAA